MQRDLLRNDGGNRQHWLKLDVRLPGGRSPAIGARVSVTAGGLTQIQDVQPVVGYLSQADARCHFGLAEGNEGGRSGDSLAERPAHGAERCCGGPDPHGGSGCEVT